MNKKILIGLGVILVILGVILYPKLISNKLVVSEDLNNSREDINEVMINGLGYSLNLPKNMVEEKNGDYSRLYYKKTSELGAGPTNFIYISVVPRDLQESDGGHVYNYNYKDTVALRRIQNGESVTLSSFPDSKLNEYYVYKRLDDKMLGGYGAAGYQNNKPWEFPKGTIEKRYYLYFNTVTYLIGYYVGGDLQSSYSLSEDEAEAILESLKLDPDNVSFAPSPTADPDWKKYNNSTFKLSFEYPSSWLVRESSQSFENGDLFALQVVGKSQRPQSEMHDGILFSVMNPVKSDENASIWAKRTYGEESEVDPSRPPVYSQVSFGGKKYEKIYVCGLGCFTYYHIKQNGLIYGFMVTVAGPNAASYEETASRIMSSIIYE